MKKNGKFIKIPWSVEDTIENLNAVKEIMKEELIKVNLDGKGNEDVKEVEFDFDRAIKALEKQEKIKKAFTHYLFSGNEMNVMSDCIKCLLEIKNIMEGKM